VTVNIAALMQLRPDTRDRTPPDADFGRAACLLADEGIRVLVAGPGGIEVGTGGVQVRGFTPVEGSWNTSGAHRLDAVFNRLPSRLPGRWSALLDTLGQRGIPAGNPPGVNALALDKARSCRLLASAGVPVPEIELDPTLFGRCLDRWGAAFLKPRYGSFGAGVSRLLRGQPLPAPDPDQPTILQRAVPPPPGPFAGVCVRGFLQRDRGGAWRSAGRVARASTDDPVANVARGARGMTVAELEGSVPAAAAIGSRLDPLERRVAEVVEGAAGAEADRILEIGTDWVFDASGEPQLVEINGKPGGRLRILAGLPGEEGRRWTARHQAALTAPFRRLAVLATAT
jgi:hypothetical protein